MVGKIMVPFCVLNNIRHLIFRVPKKGAIFFDHYLYDYEVLGPLEFLLKGPGSPEFPRQGLQ